MSGHQTINLTARHQKRIANLLQVVLLLLFVVSFLLGINGVVQGRVTAGAGISLVFAVLCLGMLWLVRRGISTPVRILIPSLILLALTYTIWQDGTIQSIDVGALYLVIALGAFLLGARGVTTFGALSLVVVTAVYVAERNNGDTSTNFAGYATVMTAITSSTLLLRYAVDWLEESNREVFSYARSLEERTAELQDANDQLQRSQAANALLLQSIPDVLFRLNKQGELVQYKPPLQRWAAFPETADIDFTWHDFLTDDDVLNVLATIRHAIHTGEAAEKTYMYHEDGREQVYEVRIVPSDKQHVLVMVRDITSLARRAVQEAQAKRLESVGMLARGLAHDYRNVLAGTSLRSEIALGHLDEASPAHKQVAIMQKSAQEMGDFIRELMAYVDNDEVEPTLHDVNQLLQKSIDMIRSSLPIWVIVNNQVVADEAIMISAEPGLLKQTFINMMMNAGQAMAEKGGTLTIAATTVNIAAETVTDHYLINPLPTSGRYARITFADNGIGMTRDTMKRIFDPYFSTKEQSDKTKRGLGLASTPTVIEKHNGTISIQSIVGQGTTFTIYLPIVADTVIDAG